MNREFFAFFIIPIFIIFNKIEAVDNYHLNKIHIKHIISIENNKISCLCDLINTIDAIILNEFYQVLNKYFNNLLNKKFSLSKNFRN
jgi:hypothetical protein